MTVGEKIKELRIDKGWSQAQLGKMVNVSQKAVDYWERNVNEPKASYLIALVHVFGLSFDDFFYDLSTKD
ncbi:MAG: helix-turn-helix transcriptional regulator [Clostridia bacterium]|nr:helix-turn-helix transcriptional regulator [Clostridia bacterium]